MQSTCSAWRLNSLSQGFWSQLSSPKTQSWGEFRCNCLPNGETAASAAVKGTYKRYQNSTVTHSRPCFGTSQGRAKEAGGRPCWISDSSYKHNALEMKCGYFLLFVFLSSPCGIVTRGTCCGPLVGFDPKNFNIRKWDYKCCFWHGAAGAFMRCQGLDFAHVLFFCLLSPTGTLSVICNLCWYTVGSAVYSGAGNISR